VKSEVIHTSVMLAECIDALELREDSVIVDATTGEGGHSFEIAKKIPQGRLICLDRNADILSKAKLRLEEFQNITFFNCRFSRLGDALKEAGLTQVDGILADLGISMFHFREEGLGFSYTDEDALDMRLDDGCKYSAADVVNRFPEKELADIIYQYGEERESRQIARSIVSRRPFTNAKDLADAVMRGKKPVYGRGIHPATKTFQALRIFVNEELQEIESFIPLCADKLSSHGRLAVLSFHSLEDRIVKWGFRALKEEGKGEILTKKPMLPSEEEIRTNPPSRSAKLRIFQRD